MLRATAGGLAVVVRGEVFKFRGARFVLALLVREYRRL